LLDYGYHPPTIYFPLVVSGALMIEPTETETPGTLDGFIDAMLAIAQEAKDDPELVQSAPHSTPVGRLDEARAARKPVLRWEPGSSGGSPSPGYSRRPRSSGNPFRAKAKRLYVENAPRCVAYETSGEKVKHRAEAPSGNETVALVPSLDV
jgi:hypothetical protein